VGATVTAPKQISVWFTEEVEPAFSRIEVTDGSGTRVDKGGTYIDPANHELLHVMVKPLASGTYKVAWHVVSVDTHHTSGDFTFTVAP
jgi:copper resistance protein C